jgi:serine/threonine protein kinase
VLPTGIDNVPGYRLLEPLGTGAFGVVWAAEDRQGRTLALKFIDCRSRPRDLIAAEVRVLRTLSELRHPHIIRLLDVHGCERHLVLVMEKADCNLEDLRQARQRDTGTNISAEQGLDLLAQAADALDFLAEARMPSLSARGLQHCDVKPSNLLLLGGELKVADFGLCAGTSCQTHNGKGWRGTWPYAAPELYHGKPAPGTDQYALAITFCKMVLGERVFWPGARPSDLPASPPINLTRVREREVPVLARALHSQPSLRYPSCRAFIDALRKAAGTARPTKGSGDSKDLFRSELAARVVADPPEDRVGGGSAATIPVVRPG